MICGYVDSISPSSIYGWAYDDKIPSPVYVDIYLDGIRIASVLANRFRQDLLDAGLRNGCSHFTFSPSGQIPARDCVVEVRVGEIVLPNGVRNASTGSNPWNADQPMDYTDSWLGANAYTRHLNYQITGSHDIHWVEYAVQKYINPEIIDTTSKSCLILGSNEGSVAVTLRNSGFLGPIVASDVADRALARARVHFDQLGLKGIDTLLADLNRDKIDGEFDFVFAEGVLHHIKNLDFCLTNVRSALKPHGLLFAMEYTGPFRFQLPEEQVAWINAAISIIPRKYRRDQHDDRVLPSSPIDQIRSPFEPPSIEHMLAFDPSEAISGHRMQEAVQRIFAVHEDKPAGGSLIFYIGQYFKFGLTNTDAACASWLEVLVAIEDALNNTGVLPFENHFYVAGK